MATPFIGQITIFAGNFAPRGWAFCNGQLLPISQNTALFSILGTTYGGNGTTTFALPDLRGRVPLGPGTGPGLSNYVLGQIAGVETVAPTLTTTLATAEAPHTHELAGSSAGTVASTTAATTSTATSASSTALPHENRQPYLAINYIIALQGIFPSRN